MALDAFMLLAVVAALALCALTTLWLLWRPRSRSSAAAPSPATAGAGSAPPTRVKVIYGTTSGKSQGAVGGARVLKVYSHLCGRRCVRIGTMALSLMQCCALHVRV